MNEWFSTNAAHVSLYASNKLLVLFVGIGMFDDMPATRIPDKKEQEAITHTDSE